MSDRGDYKEPKAGDWVVVCHVLNGDVDCLRVDSISDDGVVATLSNGSAWAVETGAPLHRSWRSHVLWQADVVYLTGDIDDLIGGASIEALGEVYGILLRDKRKREGA